MTIKKVGKNKIVVDSNQIEGGVEFELVDSFINIKLTAGGKEVSITKPGDYEYGSTGITCFEVPSDSKYQGKINLARISAEDISLALNFAKGETDKDILNNLANIDILVTLYITATKVKEDTADFDPEKLIILKNFEGGVELSTEELEKAIGVSNIQENGSYRFKSSNFTKSDEFKLETYILK